MRSPSRWLALLTAIVAFGATVFLAFELTVGGRTVGVPPAGSSPTPSGPAPTEFVPTVTTTPTTVECHREELPLPTLLSADPCPDAIRAIQLAVTAIRYPIRRIVVEPGPFHCDQTWPDPANPVTCYMPAIRPGQFMHAWVAFDGTNSVAAVMLGLDLPDDIGAPGATVSPWLTTLVAFEVPPFPWVMP